MARHITKQEQVNNIISDITSNINRGNVDIILPILKWTNEKIKLAIDEKNRINLYLSSKKINGKPRAVKQGFIYRANLGRNVGSEQNGIIRPVLVIQNSKFTITSATTLIIPLTDASDDFGNAKKLMGTHIEIDHSQLDKKSIIKAEHVRSISKNRLKDEICGVSPEIMKEVNEKLKLCFGIK